jgi:hypothetical protein
MDEIEARESALKDLANSATMVEVIGKDQFHMAHGAMGPISSVFFDSKF